jgi:hypothetical protein
MEKQNFNTEVYGAAGWPKFSTPMVGGTHSGQIANARKLLDAYIADVRKSCGGDASPLYAGTFTALTVQLNAIAEVLIDGKHTI